MLEFFVVGHVGEQKSTCKDSILKLGLLYFSHVVVCRYMCYTAYILMVEALKNVETGIL